MKWTATQEISLLDALSFLAPNSSKNSLKSWLQEGRVLVDNCVIKQGTHTVYSNQVVSLGAKKVFIEGNLTIYYQDHDLVVIEKPAGLLSVSTAFEKEATAHGYLKEHFKPRRVYVVHRLDQEASGVILFALSEKARDGMKDLFERHQLDRIYIAIVEGEMQEEEGVWSSYLYEDALYRIHSSQDPSKGKKAITHFRVINRSKTHTALEVKLETGKKNQIRVHCQEAGFPIVGDSKYGATNRAKRLCLHAHILGFTHPITKQKLFFKSPLPEMFQKWVRL